MESKAKKLIDILPEKVIDQVVPGTHLVVTRTRYYPGQDPVTAEEIIDLVQVSAVSQRKRTIYARNLESGSLAQFDAYGYGRGMTNGRVRLLRQEETVETITQMLADREKKRQTEWAERAQALELEREARDKKQLAQAARYYAKNHEKVFHTHVAQDPHTHVFVVQIDPDPPYTVVMHFDQHPPQWQKEGAMVQTAIFPHGSSSNLYFEKGKPASPIDVLIEIFKYFGKGVADESQTPG